MHLNFDPRLSVVKSLVFLLLYRLCCLACHNRPMFDTLDMLYLHRAGKKHQQSKLHIHGCMIFLAGAQDIHKLFLKISSCASHEIIHVLTSFLLISYAGLTAKSNAFQMQTPSTPSRASLSCSRRNVDMRHT